MCIWRRAPELSLQGQARGYIIQNKLNQNELSN